MLLQGAQMGAGGLSLPSLPHFNHWLFWFVSTSARAKTHLRNAEMTYNDPAHFDGNINCGNK